MDRFYGSNRMSEQLPLSGLTGARPGELHRRAGRHDGDGRLWRGGHQDRAARRGRSAAQAGPGPFDPAASGQFLLAPGQPQQALDRARPQKRRGPRGFRPAGGDRRRDGGEFPAESPRAAADALRGRGAAQSAADLCLDDGLWRKRPRRRPAGLRIRPPSSPAPACSTRSPTRAGRRPSRCRRRATRWPA